MAETQENEGFKIVLLGNSGVGKTSLINRWIDGNFYNGGTTIGSSNHQKTIEIGDEKVDLYIWDTAGQERFKALTPLYTRGSSCAILVASIIDDDSFKQLNTWIDLVKESCPKMPPLVLAVNKIDMENDKLMTSNEIEKKYKKFYSSIFYVSAVTGESVDEMFTYAGQIAKKFGKQNHEGIDFTDNKKSNPCC